MPESPAGPESARLDCYAAIGYIYIVTSDQKLIVQPSKKPNRTCFYCGADRGNATDEHIIPETIGGSTTVRPVCHRCNNGELSKLDTELCTRSPLAIVAAAELKDNRVIQELWQIDERQNNLLVEGQWDPVANVHLPYPQLIIEGERAQLRADGDEIEQIGQARFQEVFIEAAKFAFAQHLDRKGGLFFEPVDRRFFPQSNRLPPRIFSRHRLTELKIGDTFVLRYCDEEDKRHLLNKLSKGQLFKENARTEFYRGGQTLAFQVMFAPATIGRSFMKIGLNSLRWAIEKTVVNLETFPDAFGLVLGERRDDTRIESENGFVRARDLASMECQPGEHRIWIMRDDNRWRVKIAFFGGQIGGISSFEGPSNEEWKFVDMRCPIYAPIELVRRSDLYVSGSAPVQSGLFSEIAPSIGALNSQEGRFVVRRKLDAFHRK